jgi:catechol-2,3-dioxygenase
MVGGIVFLRTAQFDEVKSFYLGRVGMTVWLEQPDISILRHGNLLLGLHRQPTADLAGVVTFFYDSREAVDTMYAKLSDIATTEPRENKKYSIYNFFGADPEGRAIEFQHFLHPLSPISND